MFINLLEKLNQRYPDPEAGRIGYLVLYLLGAPVGLLLVLWVVLGDNLLTKG